MFFQGKWIEKEHDLMQESYGELFRTCRSTPGGHTRLSLNSSRPFLSVSKHRKKLIHYACVLHKVIALVEDNRILVYIRLRDVLFVRALLSIWYEQVLQSKASKMRGN